MPKTKIWVDLEVDYSSNYQVIAYRLDNGSVDILKGSSLKKAERIIDLYDYSGVNYPGIYGEIEIDEKDFVPIDNNPLQVENS